MSSLGLMLGAAVLAQQTLSFRRAGGAASLTMPCSRWSSSFLALCNSARTAASHRKAGRAMLERTGSWLTGVAGRVPEIVQVALFSAASNLWVCACMLLLQTGA